MPQAWLCMGTLYLGFICDSSNLNTGPMITCTSFSSSTLQSAPFLPTDPCPTLASSLLPFFLFSLKFRPCLGSLPSVSSQRQHPCSIRWSVQCQLQTRQIELTLFIKKPNSGSGYSLALKNLFQHVSCVSAYAFTLYADACIVCPLQNAQMLSPK